MIHISDRELQQVGNVTSAAYKGGGYVAGLGISHNLHCLVRVTILPFLAVLDLMFLNTEATQTIHAFGLLLWT